MTAAVRVPNAMSAMTKLLGVALLIVTLLPLLIFATDLPNRRVVQTARNRTLQRAGVTLLAESPDARRERIRVRRAQIHPTVQTVVMSTAFQLVILTAIAVVGRRLFALRL